MRICRRDAAAASASLSHDGALLIREHRMFDFPRLDWLEVFRDRVNADPEMKLVGEFFTTSIALTFGETRYVLRVENGRINAIVPNPRIDVRAAFGFRAPLEVWSKFLSPTPPPLSHDFFAMLIRVPPFFLDTDSLIPILNAHPLPPTI